VNPLGCHLQTAHGSGPVHRQSADQGWGPARRQSATDKSTSSKPL
jgi:hypothetical protein